MTCRSMKDALAAAPDPARPGCVRPGDGICSRSAHAAGRTTVADTQPAWATPANLARPAAGSTDGVLGLARLARPRRRSTRTLAGLYDPHRRPTALDDACGVPRPLLAVAAQVDAVRTWLTDSGFDIVDVPKNRLFVTASGTVDQVEQTFDVHENLYRIDGRTVRAPDADPAVPAGISADVRAITGLDGSLTLATPEHRSPAPPPPSGTSVGPCSHYWGEHTSTAFPNPYAPGTPLPWLICGYTPAQIDSAYGIDRLRWAGLDGRGQTIAITGAFFSPTLRRTPTASRASSGCPVSTGRNYRQVDAPGTQRFPRTRPRPRAGTSSRRSTSSGRTPSPRPRGSSTSARPTTAGGLDQAVNDVVDRPPGEHRLEQLGPARGRTPRGARSWR